LTAAWRAMTKIRSHHGRIPWRYNTYTRWQSSAGKEYKGCHQGLGCHPVPGQTREDQRQQHIQGENREPRGDRRPQHAGSYRYRSPPDSPDLQASAARLRLKPGKKVYLMVKVVSTIY
jgi:hypothetical protein